VAARRATRRRVDPLLAGDTVTLPFEAHAQQSALPIIAALIKRPPPEPFRHIFWRNRAPRYLRERLAKLMSS
jgi:hypothetical protein